MNDEATKRSVAATGVLLAVTALLWLGVLAVLLSAVPRYEHVYRDQGRHVSPPTLWTFAAGRWAGDYWYVVPLFGLLVLPLVVPLSWLLRHRAGSPLPGWLWLGALAGVPLLLLAGVWLALLVP